jgi:hypothetical protein
MKIARRELSICSYCSAPIGVGGAGASADSAVAQRLGKMKEHKDYAAAMAWHPPEEVEVEQARRRARRALWLGALAAGLLAWGLSSARGAPLARPPIWAAAAVGGLAALLAARCARTTWRARSMPLLRRAALVKNRRSETSPSGGRFSTVYFFDLEFEDGGGGEFRFPGRGAHYDPLVPGNTGIAYTRRDVLLEFKSIRV